MHLAGKLYKNIKLQLNDGMHRFDPRAMDKKKLGYAFRVLTHPIQLFGDIKNEGAGSLFIANAILFAFFLLNAFGYSGTGMLFTDNKPEDFNLLGTFASSVIVVLLWTIANWGICTLFDGKGKFSEIWIVTCYSLMPMVVAALPRILLSNIFTLHEAAYYHAIGTITLLWTIVLVLAGMLIIHQYTLLKTILSSVFAVAGIFALIFLAILFFSVVQQFVSFIGNVARELLYR